MSTLFAFFLKSVVYPFYNACFFLSDWFQLFFFYTRCYLMSPVYQLLTDVFTQPLTVTHKNLFFINFSKFFKREFFFYFSTMYLTFFLPHFPLISGCWWSDDACLLSHLQSPRSLSEWTTISAAQLLCTWNYVIYCLVVYLKLWGCHDVTVMCTLCEYKHDVVVVEWSATRGHMLQDLDTDLSSNLFSQWWSFFFVRQTLAGNES